MTAVETGGLLRSSGWTLAVGILTIGPLALFPDAGLWAGFAPADCLEYCEGSHRCGALADRPPIQQPLNTVSNLAYLFAGLLVAFRRPDLAGRVFAAAMALLFVGSAFFHASMTRPGQWLDVAGMYVSLNALAGFALHAAGVVSFARSLPFFLALDAVLLAFKWSLPTIPILAVLGAIPLAVLVSGVRRGVFSWGLALAPYAVFALGYGLRELDVQGVGCDPESVLYQGHTVWHATSAVFLWGAFALLQRVETARAGR